jgi:hypothetical protein
VRPEVSPNREGVRKLELIGSLAAKVLLARAFQPRRSGRTRMARRDIAIKVQ